MDKKYRLGEEFLEITFQVPKYKHSLENVADSVLKNYPEAVNVNVIPCKIVKEPPRLSVSKDYYSYTTWNVKQQSQIIESDEVKPNSSHD